MQARFPKTAVFAAVAALATSAGVSIAANDRGDTAAGSRAASSGPPGGPGHHGPGRANLAALAKELGVTQAKLRAALEAVRPARDPGECEPPSESERDAMAAALAKELGLPVDKVTAALEAVRPDHGERGERSSDRQGSSS